MEATNSIKQLCYTQQLQKAVLMYMVKFFLPRSEKEGLSQLFENIDDNKDS